jgi:hypothetical protein
MSGLVPEALAGLPTLSQIIEALAMEMASASEAVVPEAPQVRNGTEATPDQAIYRHEVSLKSLLTPDFLDFRPAEDHSCLLTDDGSSTTVEVAQALSARGWQVVVLSFPRSIVPNSASLPAGIRHVILEDLSEAHLTKQLAAITEAHGPISNFIAIMPANPVGAEEGLRFFEAEKAMVKQIFLMAKHLKQSLNEAPQEGRNCFLTVARLDGQFGLSKKTHFGVIGGGLFGLTKTLNQEWPTVFCRALDVNRLLSPEQAAAAIIAELHDPDADPVEVGYSSQGRVTLVGKKAPLTGAPQNQLNRIDRSSVFVVSGGAKGIDCFGGEADGIQTMYFYVGSTQRRHQDQYYLPGCMSAWCAFVDVGPDNGTIWVQPGSHRGRLVVKADFADLAPEDNPVKAGARYNDEVDRVYEQNGTPDIPVEAQAGDVVLFSGRLNHRGGPIGTPGSFRHVMANHYIPHNFTGWPYPDWRRYDFDGNSRCTQIAAG